MSSKTEPIVSVRLVTADYYMSSPIPGLDIGYSTYRGQAVKKVPVIRIFGSTSTGYKVCLHIHGVFPYFYIPYDGSAPPEQMGHQIVMALDKAINILQGQGTSSIHHVFKAVLVSGVPIYGYHAKEHQFFKVYFYNPSTRKHSYDLLLNGAALRKILQPCEAHIPFILQFLMDFNLQGMNFIDLKSVFARRTPNGTSFPHSKVDPVSTCEMELDCLAGDILNSLDVQDGIQMNPGLAALWDEEIERRKLKNMSLDNINPPVSQPRQNSVVTSSHTFYMANLTKQLKECARRTDDISMSFWEVNEQLETSLAIETPDREENKLLSASSIDLHVPTEERQLIASEEETDELLDILYDLADEHGSSVSLSSTTSKANIESSDSESQNSRSSRMTVTTPILEIVSSNDMVEDLPFDEDSVLGTQSSRISSANILQTDCNEPTSDESDEERETLEMSQIFEGSEDLLDMLQDRRFAGPTPLVQITEQEENEDDSSDSYMETDLPNVDGADDDSSEDDSTDDESHGTKSAANTKARKYNPLLFRPSLNRSKPALGKVNLKACTALQLTSPSSTSCDFPMDHKHSLVSQKTMPRVSATFLNDFSSESRDTSLSSYTWPAEMINQDVKFVPKQNSSEYTDALFAMSYLSPLPTEVAESPPRPETPIKNARIVIQPLLQDISAHEGTSGCKITLNSGKVLLRDIEEEIVNFQNKTQLKLRLPSSALIIKKPSNNQSYGKRKLESSSHDEEKIKSFSKETVITTLVEGGERRESCLSYPDTTVTKERIDENAEGLRILNESRHKNNEESKTTKIIENIAGDAIQAIQDFHERSAQAFIENEEQITKENTFCEATNNYFGNKRRESVGMIVPEENKSDSDDKETKFDEASGSDANFNLDSLPIPPEATELHANEDEAPSDKGSLSGSVPSWLGSSHSISQSPSRPSSTLQFLCSDSSNSIWTDETIRSEEDYVFPKENASLSTQDGIVCVQKQVFHSSTVYASKSDGPTRKHVISTMALYNIPLANNGAPFWSDPKDLIDVKSKDFRRSAVPIGSSLVRNLPDFVSGQKFPQIEEEIANQASSLIALTPLVDPPSRQSVVKWLEEHKVSQITPSNLIGSQSKKSRELDKETKSKDAGDRSQLEAASLNNSFGFRVSFGNFQEAKAVHKNQFLTILSVEIHIDTRQSLRPDPEFDAVTAIFYTVTNDVPLESQVPDILTGVIVVHQENLEIGRRSQFFHRAGIINAEIMFVNTEIDLFEQLAILVSSWNPDILVGYEIEMVSWGYLLQRSKFLGIPLHNLLSRIPETVPDRPVANPEDVIEGGYMVEKNSDINIPGRIILNLWRILRVEIALQSYTFENMLFHILHRRVSTYSFEKLTAWWKSNHDRWQVVEHYFTRVRGNIELMEQLDVIGRTSELARLFGIQFYEVFTRGSQYRVESMMLRLAKPKNFIAVSPSVTQRSRMKAPEWLPLILEPESKFYTDPVLVLDFQSLYPSMIIAYNYCYSTCLGRTHLIGKNEPFEFGCTQLLIPPAVVQYLVKENLVNISPAGVVFVKPEIRRGIIPQMLSEILNTRIMVKQSMKEYEGDTTLRRVFDARQLGLKLIANVTYGYTSANFSGRMPCVELGDSVVSKGRETLERAIHMIEERPEWGARVVYGDTDSVFVLLPGKGRHEAFQIGEQIANAVTETNPQPVKLKFEKVYQPCILQTKKRYVGYKYESVNQKLPVYEAKGIETVRRDGCPAVVKLLERSLRVLFESLDVSKVKAYVQRQFSKILQNRISLQDFIFAKEFRGRQGYKPGACVPALEIAKQQIRIDRCSEPRIGERVPYIVIYGSPGVPLIRLVVPAEQLLVDTSLRLNGHYYITRAIIPALQRCLGLLGADVLSWYQNLPRVAAASSFVNENGNAKKATISQYFGSSVCLLCDEPVFANGLCATCESNRQASSFSLASMQRHREKDYVDMISLCRSCTGNARVDQNCISMDCPVLYRRVKAFQNLQLVSKWYDALSML